MVQGRVRTLPLSESCREDVISSIRDFLAPANIFQVLLPSLLDFWSSHLHHMPCMQELCAR
jgi:hypothetical protein